ncbi:MAG: amino acid permease [Gemmatimonadota bacterium]|nr:MAG: amino acid permease [Gemmatimonadota bacterium]
MTGSNRTADYARRLGPFDGTMLVMGGIIGAGIFLNPAIVAHRVGTGPLTIVVWVIGGVIALAGAFCFAELGALRPRAGGGYVYLRDALGSLPAFLYGWTLLLVISTGAIAAVAVTFARYAAALLGLDSGAVTPLAITAILLLSAINYCGVRPGATTQNIFTILKLVALAGLIVVGLAFAPGDAVAHSGMADLPSPSGIGPMTAAIGVALIPVLFSYGGWQQTNFVAEEMVKPERTLPQALILGVLGVVIVYVLANLAYVRQLGVDALAGSMAPAADVMSRTVGSGGARFISAGIACSTFGFLNLVILVTPRVYQAMARDGLFFHHVARLHRRYRTPVAAITYQASWAVILTLSGTYDQLLDYVVFGDWIFFGLCGVAVLVFRTRDRLMTASGFRTPGYPWVPLAFVLAALYVVVSSVLSNPRNAALGSGLMALGLPAFLYWRRTAGAGGS